MPVPWRLAVRLKLSLPLSTFFWPLKVCFTTWRASALSPPPPPHALRPTPTASAITASRTAGPLRRTGKGMGNISCARPRGDPPGATCAQRAGSGQHTRRESWMRQLTPALAILCAAFALGPPNAHGAPVLDVTAHGVRVDEEPALDGPWTESGPLRGSDVAASAAGHPQARVAKSDLVKRTIEQAFAKHSIDRSERSRY